MGAAQGGYAWLLGGRLGPLCVNKQWGGAGAPSTLGAGLVVVSSVSRSLETACLPSNCSCSVHGSGGLPPQPSLALLIPGLPSEGVPLSADPAAAGQLYGVLKCLRRVAARLAPADAQQALASNLLPGLCAAYCSPIADVRKATVDCLVELWMVGCWGWGHYVAARRAEIGRIATAAAAVCGRRHTLPCTNLPRSQSHQLPAAPPAGSGRRAAAVPGPAFAFADAAAHHLPRPCAGAAQQRLSRAAGASQPCHSSGRCLALVGMAA